MDSLYTTDAVARQFEDMLSLNEKRQEATVYVANLDSKVDEGILAELFTQVAPVVSVQLPKDRVSNSHSGYAFVEFRSIEDAEYAIAIMSSIMLYGKPIRCTRSFAPGLSGAAGESKSLPTLFVGNLSAEVTEAQLQSIFSRFTGLRNIRINRTPEGVSKGSAMVAFEEYSQADRAIEAINGQYVGGRPVSVAYAFKPGSAGYTRGVATEQFGSAAERVLNQLASKTLIT